MKQDSYVTSSPASPPTVCARTDSDQPQGRGEGAASEWPQPGDKMRFLGRNGYDHELKAALDAFAVGEVLIVEECRVAAWVHRVRFINCPGWHNGVMFERVSDEQPQAENPKGLSPQGATEVVERLKALLALDEVGALVPHGVGGLARDLLAKSAQVIEAQAAEIEKKRRQILRLCEDSEELTWERDEEAGRAKDLGKELGQWKERAEREHGLHLSACRSLGEALAAKEAAESRLADAVKVIEPFAAVPIDRWDGKVIEGNRNLVGYDGWMLTADMVKAARSFLSTGGDSQ